MLQGPAKITHMQKNTHAVLRGGVLMEPMQLLEALHYMPLTKSLLMCACSLLHRMLHLAKGLRKSVND